MSTPKLQLNTLFKLNDTGRIEGLREPGQARGPICSLIRGLTECAWAIRADVTSSVASELERLFRTEPPVVDLRVPPRHADEYLALVRELVASGAGSVSFGPAFTFPESLPDASGAVLVQNEADLRQNFEGWTAGEIAAGRGPVLAVLETGVPVSICYCARLADAAAEAGLDTAAAYRRRGFGARVTVAWALAIRASGRIPLYSTAWTNAASLAVARKLALKAYASDWSISG